MRVIRRATRKAMPPIICATDSCSRLKQSPGNVTNEHNPVNFEPAETIKDNILRCVTIELWCRA